MILQPPGVLLAGPAGSGKTSSLITQLLCGLEVFVIVTEPDGVASLLDSAERLKADIDKLHWVYCPPASAGWSGIEEMINKVSTMDQKQLADQRDMGKGGFRAPAIKLLNAFRSFTCDRTGEDFGDFTTWDDSRSLNVDSLTGWSLIGFGATVGYKPTANPGEWGIAQNFIYNMLVKINTDRRCFFSLTTHIEKEMDDLTGVKRLMVSTIGAKLAPKIPPFFSEVVKCSRAVNAQGIAEFSWSTLDSGMDLKNRALPIASKMPADWKPIVDSFRRRRKLAGGLIVAPPAEPTTPVAPATPKPMPVAPMSPTKAT